MDTPLHALAAPEADPATLKRPEIAAAKWLARLNRCCLRAPDMKGGGRDTATTGEEPHDCCFSADTTPQDGKLLAVDARGCIRHTLRSAFVKFLRPGDLVVANDAATLPASLQGVHLPTGVAIEVRLAGMRSLDVDDMGEF